MDTEWILQPRGQKSCTTNKTPHKKLQIEEIWTEGDFFPLNGRGYIFLLPAEERKKLFL